MTIFLPTDMSADRKTNMYKILAHSFNFFNSNIKLALEGTLTDADDLVLGIANQDPLYHLLVVWRFS